MSEKKAAVQQLNDELAQSILRASKNSPLVALGLKLVGPEQMTTLFGGELSAMAYSRRGFPEAQLKDLGHLGGSPVDFEKPTVIASAADLARQGPSQAAGLAHEYGHAGISALAKFKKHNIGPNLEEAIIRYQDISTGSPEVAAESLQYITDNYADPETAMQAARTIYEELSEQAKVQLWHKQQK